MSAVPGRVIIYGGRGALGNACVSYFKSQNWWVGSIDMTSNDEAHANIVVQAKESWVEQEDDVLSSVEKVLNGDKLDALICVAGGWCGGSAASKDFIKNSDIVWKQSVWTSVISCKLASKYLKEGGFISLTGAKAALDGTPGMIGYGLAKASVHQLVKSLALPQSGLPKESLAIAILPVTLDTPMNRKFMPDADFSTWTPLTFVAEILYKWSTGVDRPTNGSLAQLVTTGGNTEVLFA